jgi:Tfp pilus assembly protein PilZ
MTESQRALTIMGVDNPEQRRKPRHSVHASGTISVNGTSYVAWIKDIADGGLFVFTKYHPKVGESVHVTFDGRKLPSSFQNAYQGSVIRVHNGGNGAAVGIAILLA